MSMAETATPLAPGAASRPGMQSTAHDSPIATLELDRFCPDCGYNLRTLPITRDERTGIFIVRCTECGRYHPANDGSTALRPWAQRLTGILLTLWLAMVAAVVINLGLAEGALSYATLDELTIHSGYTTQSSTIGTRTYTWRSGTGPLQVHTELEYRNAFIGFMLGLSAITAFACGTFCVVVFPHWRRPAALGLLATMPILVAGVVAFGWKQEAPHLLGWGLLFVIGHMVAQLIGGMVGVFAGRATARLAVRIGLPPSVRPRLAYLWLVDGKPLPRVES